MNAVISLPSRLDHTHAAMLAQAIFDRRGQNIIFRAGGVTGADIAGIQVLLSAARTWTLDGRGITLDAPSEAFEEQLGLFGLSLNAFRVTGRPN